MACLRFLPPAWHRLEYDAYRTDLEELNLGPRDTSTLCRLDAAQTNFQTHRTKYEKLRADVAVKLKFLEENKVDGWASITFCHWPAEGCRISLLFHRCMKAHCENLGAFGRNSC